VQEEGLTNEGRHHLLELHKRVTKKALHECTNRATLTAV